jgi:hypothetical protein
MNAETYLAAKHDAMTTCKPVFCCFFLLFTATIAMGQSRDSLLRLYNNQTIYRYGNNFQKGTDRLYFRNLSNEFSFSPIGLAGYELSKRHRTTATVLRVLSVAASVATISFISREKHSATYAVWGGQIALSLAGFYYQDRSNKEMDRALWQRNKDLLLGQ